MDQVNTVINTAASQIGTVEDPKGSNRIKYNTDYYGRVVSGSSYPWCMVFVWWVFRETGLSKLFYEGRKTASCTTLMRWAKNNNLAVFDNYQAGDVFFYDWDGEIVDSEHTGIYTGVIDSAGRYLVIEGNTNDKVDQVARYKSSVICAFRPKWEDKPEEDKDFISLPELHKGSVGRSVQAMQILLIGYGYSCGKWGADGDFGNDTFAALQKYQKDKSLDADGICGVLTWTSLLK